MLNRTNLRRHTIVAGVFFIAVLSVQKVWADVPDYPDRSVNVVIPYPAGGSGDTTVRFIGRKLSERWGKPVIVENKAGASGIIGTQAVGKASPDGYTALFTTTLHIQNEAVGKKAPYNPITDFVPVGQVLRSPAVLVVSSAVSANSFGQYVDFVKSQQSKPSFGSAGNATTSHLYGELFTRKTGLTAVHVPYKGGAPMMTDLLGGHINYAVIDVGSVMPMLKAGKVKVFAITGAERSSLLPNIPTFKELGFTGFESYGWMGFLLPKNTPTSVTEKWEVALSAITKSPEYTELINGLGMEPTTIQAAQFSSVLKSDIANWRRIAEEARITAE
ncbi:Bug family tripartite tricarboxylate transporter substrate binding protein [Noviherbaspirillum sp. Root189]|uniref:Bug family tripartite tricarboxylate transporter substrate binding protein n=1 Tax=Noviherbaspirillum sp. Root189 TaxID=1736487 RepID=UPI000A978BDE|nr:tripartite tricarboxylate transporter substrate binding protein [Noviherbaspirillum sp. Root189]